MLRTTCVSLVLVCMTHLAAAQLPVLRQFDFSPDLSFSPYVADAGDIDLDGYADVIFGQSSSQLRSGRTGEILATFSFGGPHHFEIGSASWRPQRIGDLNGDGVDDFVSRQLVANSLVTVTSGEALRAFVLGTIPTTPNVLYNVVKPFAASNFWGTRRTKLDDLDGDGGCEWVIGDGGTGPSGAIYVYHGASGALLYQRAGVPNPIPSEYGSSVSAVGDINLDGYGDVAVGAPRDGFNGRVYVVSGEHVWKTVSGLTPLTPAHLASFGAGYPAYLFGMSVAGISDVTGDGIGDLAIGAPATDPVPGPRNSGDVLIHNGATGALVRILNCGILDAYLGSEVVAAGDMNGDGIGDIAAGAPYTTQHGPQTGTVYAYSGADGAEILYHPGVARESFVGFSIAGLGDTNGDALADIAVGSVSSPTQMPPTQLFWLLCGAGARRYGVPVSAAPLDAAWQPGTLPTTAAGAVVVTGASPYAQAVLAVATRPANTSIAGLALFVDLNTSFNVVFPVDFDALGSWAFPADLHYPQAGGLTYFIQVFELFPIFRESNGLQILFSR